VVNQDTFYCGTLKGAGKVYVQVIVDVSCSSASAKVYTSKMQMTACDLLWGAETPSEAQAARCSDGGARADRAKP
jgi:hypothetical protein